jgi:hypothetical protein
MVCLKSALNSSPPVFGGSTTLWFHQESGMITASDLNAYLGKNISDICDNNYVQAADNHCAHFVSHAMNYSFGYTCKAAVAGAPRIKAPTFVFTRCLAVVSTLGGGLTNLRH